MFIASGIGKMAVLDKFSSMLIATGFFRRSAQRISIIVSICEIVMGLSHFLYRRQRNIYLSLSAMVLSMFSAFLVSAKLNGRDVECNCFGRFLARLQGRWAVLRNIGLVGLALLFIEPEKMLIRFGGVQTTWRVGTFFGAIGTFAASSMIFSQIHRREPEIETGPIRGNVPLYDSLGRRLDAESIFRGLADRVAIIYLSEGCSACEEVANELSRSGRGEEASIPVTTVCYVEGTQMIEMAIGNYGCHYFDIGGSFGRALRVKGAPSTQVVDTIRWEVVSHSMGKIDVRSSAEEGKD
jgi:hypothetical protein